MYRGYFAASWGRKRMRPGVGELPGAWCFSGLKSEDPAKGESGTNDLKIVTLWRMCLSTGENIRSRPLPASFRDITGL